MLVTGNWNESTSLNCSPLACRRPLDCALLSTGRNESNYWKDIVASLRKEHVDMTIRCHARRRVHRFDMQPPGQYDWVDGGEHANNALRRVTFAQRRLLKKATSSTSFEFQCLDVVWSFGLRGLPPLSSEHSVASYSRVQGFTFGKLANPSFL